MTFANPWGLLGLLALPAILVIHLYHRRFPPLVVAGLHLWGAETQTRIAGRRRERLPMTATLLLELLAALLMTLVLSRPQLADAQTVTHLVVVLDDSASMSATSTDGKSFRDAVVEDLQRRVNRLSRGSVLTIILTGRRPVMLADPASDWNKAQNHLQQWQPSASAHDFQPAWDLAAQLAEESGRLLFYTDRLPGSDVTVPQQMEIMAVGRPGGNVAVTSARWSFDSASGRGNVFLRAGNYGKQPADVTVLGRSGRRDVFRKMISIDGGASVSLESEVPGGLGVLNIELQTAGDRLDIDNRVTLIEPKVRMLDVALALPKNHPAFDAIQRVLEEIPDLNLTTGNSETAQLVIAPVDPLPVSRGDLWWMGVGPLDLSEEARENAKDLIGPYLLEKRNPLLDGVVLGGVIWGGVQPVQLDVKPLITAGRFPLLSQLEGTQTTAYLLNIDLSRPNLTDSPDWPILVKNLIDLRRDNLPGLRRWNYRLNEDVRFRLYEENVVLDERPLQELALWHEGKSRPLARSGIVEVPPLSETGIYEIHDGDKSLGEFSVNFHDPEESTLLGLNSGNRKPARTTATQGYELDNPYTWLILLGLFLILLVVLLDWKVLFGKRQRRVFE